MTNETLQLWGALAAQAIMLGGWLWRMATSKVKSIEDSTERKISALEKSTDIKIKSFEDNTERKIKAIEDSTTQRTEMSDKFVRVVLDAIRDQISTIRSDMTLEISTIRDRLNVTISERICAERMKSEEKFLSRLERELEGINTKLEFGMIKRIVGTEEKEQEGKK